jgi:hypothetical protein
MLLPAKGAFRFRHQLVTQFRSVSLRKEGLGPLQIPATLFRSDEHVADLPDHGWNKLCNQLVVVPVRGGHNFGGDVPVDRGELSARLLQAIEISLNGDGKRGDADARLVTERSR